MNTPPPVKKREDLTGMRFGRLVALSTTTIDGRNHWVCQCDCGNTKTVAAPSLKRGLSNSCGCLRKEITSARKQTHGQSETPTYKIWRAMRDRCLRKNNPHYKDYGARGITICERWDNYANFLEDMGERPAGLSIERRDNEKSYSKENCYWATSLEQNNNRRDNIWLEFNGKKQTINQWGRELGFKLNCLTSRISAGWSIEDALTIPPGRGFVGKGTPHGK